MLNQNQIIGYRERGARVLAQVERLRFTRMLIMQLALLTASCSAAQAQGPKLPSNSGALPESAWTIGAVVYTTADPIGGVLFRIGETHGPRRSKVIIDGGAAAPVWSPDGNKIAFCTDEVESETSAIAMLRQQFGVRNDFRLTVNRLQGLVVHPSWFSSIAVMDYTGSKKTILTAPRGVGACDPAWSPSAKQIAYSEYDRHSNISVIHIMDSDGGNSRAVTEGYRPQWSPDGMRLVFYRAPKGPGTKSSVWIVNTDGSELKSLTDENSISWTPTWTNKGTVLFASNREGDSAIYEIAPDGSNPKKIATAKEFKRNGGLYVPRPSPDGKQLLVDNYGAFGIATLVLWLDGSHRIGFLDVWDGLDVAPRWERQ